MSSSPRAVRCGATYYAAVGVAMVLVLALAAGCSGDGTRKTTSGAPSASSSPTSASPSPNARRFSQLDCDPGENIYAVSGAIDPTPTTGGATPEDALDREFAENRPPAGRDNASRQRVDASPDEVEFIYIRGNEVKLIAVARRLEGRWYVDSLQACNTFMFGAGA